MAAIVIFIAFTLLPVSEEGEMSIRFHPYSLLPTNEDFLKDNSSETCTEFKNSENTSGQQHTQFRIRTFPVDVGDINITITGSNLGCGNNLYVSPLSPGKSEQWIGRWTSCQLVEKYIYGVKESCLYWCKSPGRCKETQILKIPRHLNENLLEICQITITANTSGEVINLAMTPGTTCTASSEYDVTYKCSNAKDGIVDSGSGNPWAARTASLGEWILITFPSLVGVEQLEVWHRCALQDQVRILQLAFSYDIAFQVNGICDGSNSDGACVGKRFSLYDFYPAVVTEWVKITGFEFCSAATPKHFGIFEVKAYGRFMGK